MQIYEGKSGRRKYLLLPKKEYDQFQAVKYASEIWHCRPDEIIVGGAGRKNSKEFYVEMDFDFGAYWSLHRGCKTDTEYLKKFLLGSKTIARKEG